MLLITHHESPRTTTETRRCWTPDVRLPNTAIAAIRLPRDLHFSLGAEITLLLDTFLHHYP